MTERGYLWLAELLFGMSCLLTWQRWRSGQPDGRLRPINYITMLAGFALQTTFLYLRGKAIGRCPLTTPFEMTIFIAWAAVLFYLLIGPSYRLSFLGAFTAPIVLAIGAVALLGLSDMPRATPLKYSPWVDFHAAIGILACGAFALAGVIGAMYLRQEDQLKSRRPHRTLALLPAVEQLDIINHRLVLLGFVMLTFGMLGGVVSQHVVGQWMAAKTAWAVTAWVAYGGVVGARWAGRMHARRMARYSIALFGLLLLSFWLVYLLPVSSRPAP